MICQRCGRSTIAYTMSMFNTQEICIGKGSCKEREEQHPDYERARETELAAVQSGNTNFGGIGLPSDLRGA